MTRRLATRARSTAPWAVVVGVAFTGACAPAPARHALPPCPADPASADAALSTPMPAELGPFAVYWKSGVAVTLQLAASTTELRARLRDACTALARDLGDGSTEALVDGPDTARDACAAARSALDRAVGTRAVLLELPLPAAACSVSLSDEQAARQRCLAATQPVSTDVACDASPEPGAEAPRRCSSIDAVVHALARRDCALLGRAVAVASASCPAPRIALVAPSLGDRARSIEDGLAVVATLRARIELAARVQRDWSAQFEGARRPTGGGSEVDRQQLGAAVRCFVSFRPFDRLGPLHDAERASALFSHAPPRP